MMSKTSVKTKTSVEQKKTKTKPCHLGCKCPYKDEYQHQLEFSHSSDIAKDGKISSKSASFVPFTGKGHRLGTGLTGLNNPLGFITQASIQGPKKIKNPISNGMEVSNCDARKPIMQSRKRHHSESSNLRNEPSQKTAKSSATVVIDLT